MAMQRHNKINGFLSVKRIYGGKFSNHTKGRILKESPLIDIFKNMRIQVQNNFRLEHRTIKHSAPAMQRTFALLGTYMQKHKTNSYEPGRTALYSVTDVMRKGMHILMTTQPLA